MGLSGNIPSLLVELDVTEFFIEKDVELVAVFTVSRPIEFKIRPKCTVATIVVRLQGSDITCDLISSFVALSS